jgi:hypothetical protein
MIWCMAKFTAVLRAHQTTGTLVKEVTEGVWHLEIPAGPKRHYRLAQMDDYHVLLRSQFPWQPPLHIAFRARASAQNLPGTWGFGLWNDPFSLSLGLGGGERRFPALPNAAWFFYASPPNYLSFRNDLPAQGFLAATFQSRPLPSPLLALAAPLGALLVIPGVAQLGRWLLRQFIRQDAYQIETDVTEWHTYELDWQAEKVKMYLDGQVVLETAVSPNGPLGLVIWIDNQYAALPPTGILAYGALANPEAAWIEFSLE